MLYRRPRSTDRIGLHTESTRVATYAWYPATDHQRNQLRCERRDAIGGCVVCGKTSLYYTRTGKKLTGFCKQHKPGN